MSQRGGPTSAGGSGIGGGGGAGGGSGVGGRGALVRRGSSSSGALVRRNPSKPNTEWEFRLFPLRTVYIDVTRASYSDKKKLKKRHSTGLVRTRPNSGGGEGEKEEPPSPQDLPQTSPRRREPEGNDDGEESIFLLLHKRFAPVEGDASDHVGVK